MRSLTLTALGCLALLLSGCDSETPGGEGEPNIVPTPEDLVENREFVSQPNLVKPIYACARTVVVKDFALGADIEVWVDDVLEVTHPNATWTGGQPIDVGFEMTIDQKVYAKQLIDGQTSGQTNTVIVSDHNLDYPGGIPAPRISRTPLLNCGRAIGIGDWVPGARVTAYAENPDGAGGFLTEAPIGNVADFGYLFCSPLIETGKVRLEQALCMDTASSPQSTVEPAPPTVATPVLDPTPIDGAEIVVFWGPPGPDRQLLNGAALEIKDGPTRIGGQPTPGGGQQVRVNPDADSTKSYDITQALCDTSAPGTVTPLPCTELPAPTILPLSPGDETVTVVSYHPGARILVFADGVEIGESGPTTINLERPIVSGETITVIQRLGDCTSAFAYQVLVECDQPGADCVGEWPAFRFGATREANQPHSTKLADPAQVRTLQVQWSWHPTDELPTTVLGMWGLTASPVVYKGMVYVGGSDGRLYALRASDGAFQWMYPPAGDPALESTYRSNPSSYGLPASATIGVIRGETDVVIFGAPDQSVGDGLGSGRLFSVRAGLASAGGGTLYRASDELAVLDSVGTDPVSTEYGELHENFGLSSPVIHNDNVYVGIADHADNPIQKGKILAVDMDSLVPVPGFTFEAAGGPWDSANGRGGGVWNSPAAGRLGGVFFTTGNTRISAQTAIPSPNHGLSLIRVDEATGSMQWKLQPVPYTLDCDPDWAAGAIVTPHGAGEMVVSTMKDGWAYGVPANTSTAGTYVPAAWQFPPTGTYDSTNGQYFQGDDGGSCSNSDHGDIRYLTPGAAWQGTYITMTAGEKVTDEVRWGYGHLHSLNVGTGAVRWIKAIEGVSSNSRYQIGPPTVTHGIVFVGTAQGRLVAIADPSVYPTADSQCSNPDFNLADCVANGAAIVKDPVVLFKDALGLGSLNRNEPVIANDQIFLTTGSGNVLMLEPTGP